MLGGVAAGRMGPRSHQILPVQITAWVTERNEGPPFSCSLLSYVPAPNSVDSGAPRDWKTGCEPLLRLFHVMT